MNKKKTLYIVLTAIAVILIAVIVVVAIKLNAEPAAGNQNGSDATTTSAVSGTVNDADETTGGTGNVTDQTDGTTSEEDDDDDSKNVVKDPETTIAPIEDEKTGIDFDELLG